MNRRLHPLHTLLVILVLAAAGLRGAYAAQPIDEKARSALERLYASSPGAKALGAKAKAVLVFPDIRKAALIVGGQTGDGVMFRNGKVAGHYRVDGLLAGFEAGAQSYAYALFFMSDAAAQKMRDAQGWEVGADPNVVVIDAGAGKDLSTTTLQADVYSYIFDQKGLMGGVALQGLKITRTGS
jgi:lipid-binding SYLF domain-containing protein